MKIDDAVLRVVRTQPFFSGLPPVRVSSIHWAHTNGSSEINIKTIGSGLTLETGTSKSRDGSKQLTQQMKYVYAANRFIALAYSNDVLPDGVLVRLDNLSGSLFPMKLGNAFGYRTELSDKAALGTFIVDSVCNVTEKKRASAVLKGVEGDAFVIICDGDYSYSKQSLKGTNRSTLVFLDHPGVFAIVGHELLKPVGSKPTESKLTKVSVTPPPH